MALTKQQVSDRLNEAVWSTYVRINTAARYDILVQNGILIPPDLAAVSMVLLDDRKRVYGDLVNGLLLPNDAAVTEEVSRKYPGGVPAGVSVLSPFKDHLDVLNSLPVIRDEWVWHDMPEDLYVINRQDLDPATRQVLLDLGYGAALERRLSGAPVYKADPAAVAAADEARSKLMSKWHAMSGFSGFGSFGQVDPLSFWLTVRTVLSVLATVAIGGAVLYAGLRIIDAVVYRIKHSREWDLKLRQEQNVADFNKIQLIKVERLDEQLKNCEAGIAAGLHTEEECARIAQQLAAIEPAKSPDYSRVPGCGFSNCWPWALLGFGIGAVGGSMIAKKRGWA